MKAAFFLSFVNLIVALPVYVFETQTQNVYVTVNGGPDEVYSTEWDGGVPYTSTLWPDAASTTSAAAAAAETTSSTSPAPAQTTSDAAAPTSSTPAQTTSTTTQPAVAAANPATVTTTVEPNTSEANQQETSSAAAAAATPTVTTSTEASSTEASSTATTSTSSSSSSGGVSPPKWIVYSPYNNDGSCKDSATVESDLGYIKSKGIYGLRVYATDCNSLYTVNPAAVSLGLKLQQGVWIGSGGLSSTVDASVSDIVSWGKQNGWDSIETVIYGNEDVNDGYVTADDLIAAAWSVRGQLQSAGFTGKLLHADTTNAYLQNSQLATSSVFDIVGLNAHSYFDAYVTADQAGSFVQGQQQQVVDTCGTGSKEIFITETGYPSQGETNGGNVPSLANQKTAVSSLLSAYNNDLVILTTYNDLWKAPGPYGVEQYFGAAWMFD